MIRTTFVFAVVLAAAAGVGADQRPGRGRPDKGAKHAQATERREQNEDAARFSTRDAVSIHEYYEHRHRKGLPPGLQKRVARGEQLPPGWQKKLRPFPVSLERRLGPLPADCARGVIDGNAVVYNRRSHAVIDVTVLF
jgi:hypothetical protein